MSGLEKPPTFSTNGEEVTHNIWGKLCLTWPNIRAWWLEFDLNKFSKQHLQSRLPDNDNYSVINNDDRLSLWLKLSHCIANLRIKINEVKDFTSMSLKLFTCLTSLHISDVHLKCRTKNETFFHDFITNSFRSDFWQAFVKAYRSMVKIQKKMFKLQRSVAQFPLFEK